MLIYRKLFSRLIVPFSLAVISWGCSALSATSILDKDLVGVWMSRCIEAPENPDFPDLAKWSKYGVRYRLNLVRDHTCAMRFEFNNGPVFTSGTWKKDKNGQIIVSTGKDVETQKFIMTPKSKTLVYDQGDGYVHEFSKDVAAPTATTEASKLLTKEHIVGAWGKKSMDIQYIPMSDRRAIYGARKAAEMTTLKQWVEISFRTNGTFVIDGYVSPREGKWKLDLKTSRILLEFNGIKGDLLELRFDDAKDEIVLQNFVVTVRLGKGIVEPPRPKFPDNAR
jgi:hypothetical protein